MSDTDDRLSKIEERLRKLEQGPANPLLNASATHPTRMLVFWIGVTLVGVAVWWFSTRLP